VGGEKRNRGVDSAGLVAGENRRDQRDARGQSRLAVGQAEAIDGKLVNDALVGDYQFGTDKGGFRFTKR